MDKNCIIKNYTLYQQKGPSINDVTALGGRGYQGFCDNSTKALLIKSVTMGGGGVKNYEKLRDVSYGRPQSLPVYNERNVSRLGTRFEPTYTVPKHTPLSAYYR
jgi:hypothetical protein